MANLNLSQFGENTSVSNADYTFVWDSAASISKKVSRNSWLNSGTLTSDAPVTISQTWAGTGSTVFTAFKVNATSTASDPTSKLLDLQLGGVSQLSVSRGGSILSKVGVIAANGTPNAAGLSLELLYSLYGLGVDSNGSIVFFRNGLAKSRAGLGIAASSDSSIGWTNAAHVGGDASLDTILVRDSASGNTLALRNGAAAQTFNIYNTYQNAGIDFERIAFKWSANLFTIGREFGGTGVARNIAIVGGGSVLGIGSAATAAVSWTFSSNHFLAGTDNIYDIGASGANRPRNVYVGTTGFFAGGIDITGANGIRFPSTGYGPFWAASTVFKNVSNGVLTISNFAENDFGRLQLGGTTASFPAIKRSTVRIQAVLANDSGFTNIQGKLTTDTDYTATVVTPTGFLTLYDAQGNAYKVPCVAA